MPRGVYPRKGNRELAALGIHPTNPAANMQASIYDLELRIADLERRLEKANEYFQKGYVPPNV